MDVLIRDLSRDVHAELTRRAAARDMSLRAYLREVLSAHVAVPSMDEWLERVSHLGAAADGPSGSDLVAAARVEDDELTGR